MWLKHKQFGIRKKEEGDEEKLFDYCNGGTVFAYASRKNNLKISKQIEKRLSAANEDDN